MYFTWQSPSAWLLRYPYRLIEAGNRAGYHLVTERITYPQDLLATGKGTLSFVFRNDGCRYPDYPIYVACALLDANNKPLQQVWCDSINLKDNAEPWVTYDMADNLSGRFILPVPKTYSCSATVSFATTDKARHLAVGFFTDKSAAAPDIRLGIDGRTETGWYPIDQYPAIPQADRFPALHNLAFKKMAVVSATSEGSEASLTDGNASTRWSSPRTVGQWVSIDLGSTRIFSTIMLDWDAIHPKSYTIETSLNGSSWTALCQTGNGDGGIDYIHAPGTSARYIRLTGNDAHGLALYDIDILGSTSADRPARRRQ